MLQKTPFALHMFQESGPASRSGILHCSFHQKRELVEFCRNILYPSDKNMQTRSCNFYASSTPWFHEQEVVPELTGDCRYSVSELGNTQHDVLLRHICNFTYYLYDII
ncbi:hypothetical protein Droror1_Dr00022474 [Drosera rotundifolia]